MTDQELRSLIREIVARQLGQAPAAAGHPVVPAHPSHGLFVLPAGADSDGPCIIEPAVSCTHCGYCKSYGH